MNEDNVFLLKESGEVAVLDISRYNSNDTIFKANMYMERTEQEFRLEPYKMIMPIFTCFNMEHSMIRVVFQDTMITLGIHYPKENE